VKIKYKIVSIVINILLISVVFGFTVWAASTQALPISSTINFTSSHVLSTVTGTVTGAKEGTFENYGPISTVGEDSEEKLGSWQIGAMEFADETSPITLTLTIVNDSEERSLSFELSGQSYSTFNGTNLENTNIDRACKYSINNMVPVTNATYINGYINVEPLKTATIIMTFDINDIGKNVNNFNSSFTTILRNVANVVYSFNSEGGEIATVSTYGPIFEEIIPELSVVGSPLYYGLYTDSGFTQKISLPYSGATTLYAKFTSVPTNLILTSINDEEYSVGKSATLPTGALQLPEKYNWKPITTLVQYAFQNCTGLTSVIISDYVTFVGNGAFSGCSNLTSAVFPNSLTSIGNGSFQNCTVLGNVILPSGLTSIGGNAFYGCVAFTSFTFPNGVTSISSYIFYGCTNLASITVPSGVTSIGYFAFHNCSSLTNFTIPSGVTIILQNVFYNCSELTSMIIPNGVTSIGNNAFSGCTKLASISLPSSLLTIGNFTFNSCSSLTSFTIPNGVTSIGDTTFQACTGLTSFTFPDSVISIGSSVFWSCSNLTSVTIGSGLTTIGTSAFSSCTKITSFSVSESNSYFCSDNGVLYNKDKTKLMFYPASKTDTSYTIASTVTIINGGAFYRSQNLTSITVPTGLTSIGNESFYYCSKLASITIPSGVTTIGSSAFQICSLLKNVVIDSATIASGLTSKTVYGYLLNYFATGSEIYILDSIATIGSYVTDIVNFSAPVVVDIGGVNYKKFVKA